MQFNETLADGLLIRYEYPFNESVRTMLRLEYLFKRIGTLVSRESAIDHHFSLVTLFEIIDAGSRADVKSDLMRELDRYKSQLEGFRGNPAIEESALNSVLQRIEQSHHDLNRVGGKFGHGLTSNEWLMSIRSRIHIPGGTCEFDLPAYYAWQHKPSLHRQADLEQWLEGLKPLCEALDLVLSLLRDGGRPNMVAAPTGQYQQSLKEGKAYQLLQLRIDQDLGLIPEISGNRLMLVVRLMRHEADGRLKPATDTNSSFELTLCA